MKQTGRFLIYGATGFTGKPTTRTTKERGLKSILAGRNRTKLMAAADRLGAVPRAKYRSGTVGVLLDGNKRATAMHRSYVELDIDAVLDIAGCADGL